MMYKVCGLDRNGYPATLVTSDYKEALRFSNNGQWPIEVVVNQSYDYWRLSK
jgi:hypothetical protein